MIRDNEVGRRSPGRYDRPFLVRIEISHVDGDSADLLASLESVVRVQPRRTDALPTTEATCLLWRVSPQVAVEDVRGAFYDRVLEHRPDVQDGTGLAEHVVRIGWASVDDVLELNQVDMAWNWDTIDHDCTLHRKRIVYGMFMPSPGDDPDELAIAGCQPGSARWQCRICGAEW